MTWIDIHSHILPGIDDGAADEKEALNMLRIAAADGISHIIATPHFHYKRGHASPEQICEKADKLQKIADEENIPVKIHAGNELYYTQDLIEKVKAGEALTLAGSDYVLLEFSPETEKRKIQNAVYEFLSGGYYPIIAHMERYEAFVKNSEFIETIWDMGAYYQVNGGSIRGDFGWRTKRFARTMIKNGMVQFVATDAHDASRRSPQFASMPKWIEKKIGKTGLSDLLYDHPKQILENKPI